MVPVPKCWASFTLSHPHLGLRDLRTKVELGRNPVIKIRTRPAGRRQGGENSDGRGDQQRLLHGEVPLPVRKTSLELPPAWVPTRSEVNADEHSRRPSARRSGLPPSTSGLAGITRGIVMSTRTDQSGAGRNSLWGGESVQRLPVRNRAETDALVSHIPDAGFISTLTRSANRCGTKVSDAQLKSPAGEAIPPWPPASSAHGRDVYAAARVAQIMLYAGVKDVRILDGGWKTWSDADLPVERGLPKNVRNPAPDFGVTIPAQPQLMLNMEQARGLLHPASPHW